MSMLKDAEQRSTMAAKKDERVRDAALAMREYEAEKLAVHANTARLRALRLAKEAEQVISAKQPRRSVSTSLKRRTPLAKKGTPDPLPPPLRKRRKIAVPNRQKKAISDRSRDQARCNGLISHLPSPTKFSWPDSSLSAGG